MHEQTDPFELCTMHYMTQNVVVDTAEKGPFKVAPLV